MQLVYLLINVSLPLLRQERDSSHFSTGCFPRIFRIWEIPMLTFFCGFLLISSSFFFRDLTHNRSGETEDHYIADLSVGLARSSLSCMVVHPLSIINRIRWFVSGFSSTRRGVAHVHSRKLPQLLHRHTDAIDIIDEPTTVAKFDEDLNTNR